MVSSQPAWLVPLDSDRHCLPSVAWILAFDVEKAYRESLVLAQTARRQMALLLGLGDADFAAADLASRTSCSPQVRSTICQRGRKDSIRNSRSSVRAWRRWMRR